MENKCKIILLPTDEETNIIDCSHGLEYINKPQIANTINSIVKGFYLYILSDDEIKEGDWCISTHPFTKNPLIKVLPNMAVLHLQKGGYTGWFKIIATTNPNLIEEGITSIDDEFIREYVKNPIEEVNVEFETYMTDGWIPTYNNPDNFNLDEPAEMDYRPKLSSNGSILIKPVEEKLYTKKEVLEIAHKVWIQSIYKAESPLFVKGFTSFMKKILLILLFCCLYSCIEPTPKLIKPFTVINKRPYIKTEGVLEISKYGGHLLNNSIYHLQDKKGYTWEVIQSDTLYNIGDEIK